jgi:hypothetical protein
MRHLTFRSTILRELAQTYRPAMHMHSVVDTTLKETQWETGYRRLEQDFRRGGEGGRHIPARRDSSNLEDRTASQTTNKRRRVEQFQSTEGASRATRGEISETIDPITFDDSVESFFNMGTQPSLYNRAPSNESVKEIFSLDQGSSSSATGGPEQQWPQHSLTKTFEPLVDWEQLSCFPESMEMQGMAFPFDNI